MAHIRNWYERFCDENFSDKEWVKKSLPRFKIFSIVYILLIDNSLWNNLEHDVKVQIKESADAINNDSNIGGANVSIYDAFKAYKDANKAQCNQFILANWPAIIEIDLHDMFGRILDDLKCTSGFIERLPNDVQVRRLDPDRLTAFKMKKRKFMAKWDGLADQVKTSVISELFKL